MQQDIPGGLDTEGDVNTSTRRQQWARGHLDDATRELLERDQRVFLKQSLSTPCLNAIGAASGSTITDLSGQQILDFHGNSVHQVGYGHPRVIEAVKRQLDTLPFCPRRYTNETAVLLAERLCAIAPLGETRCLLAPGGAIAISMALKLVRQATGRHKTLSLWDAFHGATLDAISVGGEALFRKDAGPLLPGSEHLAPPGWGVDHFPSRAACEAFWADYVDYVLDIQGDVGAVVAEPMRWTTVEMPGAEFWKSVRASCDRHGTLLVFDEIPSALARSGRMFVCEHFDVEPDILVIGKGLGGAVFPMAAILARAELDVAGHLALGHFTHEKSPVGCAAALATLEVIADEGLEQRAATLGGHALGRLRELERHPLVHEARGLGLHLGIELRRDGRADRDAAEQVLYHSLERGVSYKVGGGNVLTLCPPLTIAEEQLDRALDIVAEGIRALD